MAAAASVYLWLVGFGKLLVHPEATLAAIGLVVLGFAAVPLWWRGLRDGPAST